MAYAGVEVQNTCDILRVDDLKIQHFINPVLTSPVPMLRGDRQCVFPPAEQAIQFEFYFEDIARFKPPEVALFETRVRAEDVHADPIADQNASYGAVYTAIELPSQKDANGVAAPKCATRFTMAVGQLNINDAARSISMSECAVRRNRI